MRLNVAQPVSNSPSNTANLRLWSAAGEWSEFKTNTPAAEEMKAAVWNRPSASVFASNPATVVAGWSPVAVSMWCHWSTW